MFYRILALVAIVEVGLGLILLPQQDAGTFPLLSPPLALAVQVVVFSLSGAYLLLFGQARRVTTLGVAFLIIGSTFAFTSASASAWSSWVLLLPLDAFLPLLILDFVREFPTTEKRGTLDTSFKYLIPLFACLGVLLIIANWLPTENSLFESLNRSDPASLYGRLVYIPAGLALVVMLLRARLADHAEKVRVRFFVVGLFVPGAVLCLVPALNLIPEFRAFSVSETGRLFAVPILHTALVALPLICAYAVAVDRAIEVKQMLSLFKRYWLARVVSWALVFIPLLVFASVVWDQRAVSLEQLAVSPSGLLAAMFLFFGVAALLWRTQVTRAVNSAFFRESYDTADQAIALRRELGEVTALIDVGKSLGSAIDNVLHVDDFHLVVRNDHGWVDSANILRELPPHTPFFWLLGETPTLIEDLNARLDDSQRAWLLDARAEMICPVNDTANKLAGVLLLSGKKSELPFSTQDTTYLETIASLAAPYITSFMDVKKKPETNLATQAAACYCVQCNAVSAGFTGICAICNGENIALSIPKTVAGKYDCERNLGSGSLGVALLANDLNLERSVVLKTLPQIHASRVKNLRQEARTMALLQHPNLTQIYDVASWRGMPILVMEYLEGGTLEQKLVSGPLDLESAVELAIALYTAANFLHTSGIVHCDVKPSNVGFDHKNGAKLLDFGFAQAYGDDLAAKSYLAGSPRYLPPESFRGGESGSHRDLWAIAVTVFEAVSGSHPFADGDMAATIRSITSDDPVPLKQAREECPDHLATLIDQALSKDPADRPESAEAALNILLSTS